MRRVPAICHPELPGMRRCPGNLFELQQRAVLVIQALNQQQRRRDVAAIRSNVKAAETLRQPDIVPLPKRAVYISVVFGQASAQAASGV